MRTNVVLVAAALCGLAVSTACADVVDFEGAMKFTAKNSSCAASVIVGTVLRSRIHPPTAMAAANRNWLGINRDAEMWSEAWGNNGNVATTYNRVNYGNVADHFVGRTSNLDPSGSLASIRLTAVPTGLTTNTKFLTISGQLRNPFNVSTQAACVVDFTANYVNSRYLAP